MLVAMNFRTLILMEETQRFPVQTRDDNTPISHLLQTFEAYNQGTFLKFYLMLTGLSMIQEEGHHGFNITHALQNNEIGDSVMNGQSRAEFLLTLALQL